MHSYGKSRNGLQIFCILKCQGESIKFVNQDMPVIASVSVIYMYVTWQLPVNTKTVLRISVVQVAQYWLLGDYSISEEGLEHQWSFSALYSILVLVIRRFYQIRSGGKSGRGTQTDRDSKLMAVVASSTSLNTKISILISICAAVVVFPLHPV